VWDVWRSQEYPKVVAGGWNDVVWWWSMSGSALASKQENHEIAHVRMV
jgi:hypothetical protein